MGYIHALKILPADLTKEIQQYVDGQILYIPKVETKKCRWGDNTQLKSCEIPNKLALKVY